MVRAGAFVAVGLLVAVAACPAGAVSDGGASNPRAVTSAVQYAPPVAAPVIDPFRAPAGPYAPGNRGLEYATTPGEPVVAIGVGRVVFAGQVGGRLVVSIDHPDGLRSSLLGMTSVVVRVGTPVAGGQVVGLAGPRLHLGVRRDGAYLDPSTLFGRTGPARLVPLARVPALGAGFGPRGDGH
jgi:murein DD-endopeptidase MepM/ murein hydrolase activator NlpD